MRTWFVSAVQHETKKRLLLTLIWSTDAPSASARGWNNASMACILHAPCNRALSKRRRRMLRERMTRLRKKGEKKEKPRTCPEECGRTCFCCRSGNTCMALGIDLQGPSAPIIIFYYSNLLAELYSFRFTGPDSTQ